MNNDLPKPVTPHYLPKVRESVLAKPHHVIAPGLSRNSSKESYGSNDMAHNYYLEEAKKKTQDKNRNLKPREMPSTRTHHTPNACIPKPRSNNQTSRNWPASKSCEETLKAVQKANHSRNPSSFLDFKHFVQSLKTRNSNKLVEPKNHTQKPIRWVPTGKTFTSSTTMVDCEPPNGSYEDITNPYESNQTLNVSAGFQEFISDEQEQWRLLTTLQATFLKEKKSVGFSALYLQMKINLLGYEQFFSNYYKFSCSFYQQKDQHPLIRSVLPSSNGHMVIMASKQSSLEPALHEITPATPSSGLVPNPPPSVPLVPPSRHEWDLVFQLVFDEFFSPPASVASPVLVEDALVLGFRRLYNLLLLVQYWCC
ncbi:hypothetical protein Tco_1172296 [Tanacetum coccineum]